MSKHKIRSKHLRQIGYPEHLASKIADLVNKKRKKFSQKEKITLLEDILEYPEHFIADQDLGKIVKWILPEKPDEDITISEKPKSFQIYGAEYIPDNAIEQMNRAMQLPITVAGALMPDAHQGYGLPIGGVVAAENAVIPYGVGMDIGCRMSLSVFDLPEDYIKRHEMPIKKILTEETHFGKSVPAQQMGQHAVMENEAFKNIKFLRKLQKKAYQQLGTSGSGNHFVEFGLVEIKKQISSQDIQPGVYIGVLSHSGSRNMGAEIARHYTDIARAKCRLPKGFTQLAWLNLDSEEGTEYWTAMQLAGEYSAANHFIIHKRIAKALKEKPILRIENHHNFAWKEKLKNGKEVVVHRKGATPAHQANVGLIPGSMATPAFIVQGKGNPASLNSASHGAGRLFSRNRAKATFSNKQLTDYLARAGVILLGGGIDESPEAYKDIVKIMNAQKDLVDVSGIFHPKIVRMA